MKKPTTDRNDIVRLATNYAAYMMAVSNSDEYFIVWHGHIVLESLAVLGLLESIFPVRDVRMAVKAAQERLDRFEYEASRS